MCKQNIVDATLDLKRDRFDIPGDHILHTGGSPVIPDYVQRPTVAKAGRYTSEKPWTDRSRPGCA